MFKLGWAAFRPSSRVYAGVFVFLAVCLICLPAHAELRGIRLMGGDSATSAITPSGDDDTFVIDAFEGAKLSVTVKARKGSALLPDVEVLDPSGVAIDVSAYRSGSGSSITLRSVPLPMTGCWGIRVSGREGSEGEYDLNTKLQLLKKKKSTDVVDPGKTLKYTFSADGETKIHVKLVGQGGPFEVISIVDPLGIEMPGATDHFKYKKNRATARLFPSRNEGDYTITVGNITVATQITATIRMTNPKIKSRHLNISSTEPQVDSLSPTFGREGNGIAIIGKGFQAGKITVLFDDVVAPTATYVNSTRLNVIVPPEGSRIIVDITVYNPDGQDGTKPEIFTYIPPPPEILSVTPMEVPDNGGTTINVIGDNMLFVEKIALGTDVLSSKPFDVTETSLSFVTDAHAPGLTTLTLTDEFGQTDFLSGAIYFAAPPSITSVSPPGGTKKGGGFVTLTGGGFRADSQYLFGTVPAAKVTVVSLSQVFLTTPAHPKGVVDVRIVDKWGREAVAVDGFEFVDGTLVDVSSLVPAMGSDIDVAGNAVGIGDIDDVGVPGRVDIVLGSETSVTGYYDTTRVLLRSGASGWDLSTGSRFDKKAVDALALGDVDDDGDLDVVLTQDKLETIAFYSRYYYSKNSWNYYYYYDEPEVGVRLFLNDDGLGAFVEAPDQIPVVDSYTDILLGKAVALGDVDGDDDLDMVVTGDSVVTTSYMYNGYTWSSGSTHWYYFYFYTYEDETLPATRLLTNDGTGTFENVSVYQMPDPTDGDIFAGDHMILGDADNDGDLDILITGDGANLRSSGAYEYVAGSKTRILTNDGYGYFENSTSSLMPAVKTWDDWGGLAIALGDVDGDNVNDIVITTNRSIIDDTSGSPVNTSSTRIFKGSKTGFSDATATLMPAVAADGTGDVYKGVHVAVGDPDGDGLDEIFVLDKEPVYAIDANTGLEFQVTSLRWLSRQGALPLQDVSRKQLPNPDNTGDYYLGHTFALGDIDGDGDLDLVITTYLPSYTTTGAKPTRVLEFR